MSKVAVVTGASSGIGRAFAIEFVKNGGRVALLARRKERLIELATELNKNEECAIPIQTDIASSSDVDFAFKSVIKQWGSIDVVLNNAAVINPIVPLHKTSVNELKQLIDINVFGAFLISRAAICQFRKQKKFASLINISSGAAMKPKHSWSAYCSSKAAMNMMTQVIAVENGNENMSVFSIEPGVVDSEMQQSIRETDSENFPEVERFKRLYEQNQLFTSEAVAKVLSQLAFLNTKTFHGKNIDIRNVEFQLECEKVGITFPTAIKTKY